MSAKIIMVLAMLLVSTLGEGEPTAQPSQLSNILALREGRTLDDNVDEGIPSATEPSELSKIFPPREDTITELNDNLKDAKEPKYWPNISAKRIISYDDVQRAVWQCYSATYNLIWDILNIESQTDQFKRSFNNNKKNFGIMVKNQYLRNNGTVTEYFEKAQERGRDIRRCNDNWNQLRNFEEYQTFASFDENLYKFVGNHMGLRYQYEREWNLALNDVERLGIEAWDCEYDDDCLQIVLRKVKVYEGYVKYVWGVNISESIKEVARSSEQMVAKLDKKTLRSAQKLRAITDEFVKCAEKCLKIISVGGEA